MVEYTVKVYNDGTKIWYLKGKLHREDGPACEYANGTKEWYLKGKLHREDGPACEYTNGTKEWFLKGKLHREDGPACEWGDGAKWWYLKGKLHREDGPAYVSGDGTKEWHLDGEEVTEQEHKRATATCEGKDLAKRLRDVNGWWLSDELLGIANEIEELEANLTKAEVIVRIIASDKWEERLGEAVDLSCEYLAELTGEEE